MTDKLKVQYSLKPKIAELLEERRKSVFNSLTTTSTEQNILNVTVQAALAGATVCLHNLPEKLNPVIKPLMESIKREECKILQKLAAKYLVLLLEQICDRNPCPNNKIITNLSRLLKSDAEFTPKIVFPEKSLIFYNSSDTTNANPYHGIMTLANLQKSQDLQNGHQTRGPGRPPTVEVTVEEANPVVDDPVSNFNCLKCSYKKLYSKII